MPSEGIRKKKVHSSFYSIAEGGDKNRETSIVNCSLGIIRKIEALHCKKLILYFLRVLYYL